MFKAKHDAGRFMESLGFQKDWYGKTINDLNTIFNELKAENGEKPKRSQVVERYVNQGSSEDERLHRFAAAIAVTILQ